MHRGLGGLPQSLANICHELVDARDDLAGRGFAALAIVAIRSRHRSTHVGAALGDSAHRVDEDVDLLEGVVERKRRTHRGL